jgi:hypothetical protein
MSARPSCRASRPELGPGRSTSTSCVQEARQGVVELENGSAQALFTMPRGLLFSRAPSGRDVG